MKGGREREREGRRCRKRERGHSNPFSIKNNFFMGFFNTEIIYIDCPMILNLDS